MDIAGLFNTHRQIIRTN